VQCTDYDEAIYCNLKTQQYSYVGMQCDV